MTVLKTINDLPQFHVSAVKDHEKDSGYFELTGAFDRTAYVAEGRCSLLLPATDVLAALPGHLEFQNQQAGTACIYASSEEQPDVVGQSLAYVPANWDPVHVWMVALPSWKWSKTLFHASDAIAEIVKGTDVSIVDNEEIRDWIKIIEKDKDTGLSRYYPVFPSGKSSLQIQADGIIKNGWSHVHCQLCNAHVDSRSYGYVDPGEHWVCQECYEKYVAEHDLAFMFV